jgi:hypothetical protein
MFAKNVVFSAFAVAALTSLPALAASQKAVDPSVVASLRTIRQDAELIASGKLRGKSALRAPARDIALQWAKIEPGLSVDGDVMVETKMANASIAALEHDWQTGKDVQSEAKDVSSNIDDLTDAATGH